MRRLLFSLCVMLACLASARAFFSPLDFGGPLHRHVAPDAHYMLQQRLLQQRYLMEQERLRQQCASLSHTAPLDRVRFHTQETPTDFTLKAAMPGIASHNVRLHTSPESHTLSVLAVRPVARGCEELVAPQRLERSFRLPASVDWDAISGTMEDGLLRITIPKLMPPSRPHLREQAATQQQPAQQQQQPARTLTGWEQLEQLHNQLLQRMRQSQPEPQRPQEPVHRPTQQPPLQQHVQQERIPPPPPPPPHHHQQEPLPRSQHQHQHQQSQSGPSPHIHSQPAQPTRSPTVRSGPAPARTSHASHTEPTLTIEQIDELLHLLDQTVSPAPTPSQGYQKRQNQKQRQQETSPSVEHAPYLDPRTQEPLWHHTPAPSSCKSCAPRPRPRYADEGVIEL